MMNQPVPPEQNPQAAAPVEATPEVAAAPVEPQAAAPVEGEAPAAQEEQVINEVAQGLADEEITAEDIMVAVLSDSLGLSPQGAASLFQLLMTDLAEDAAPTEEQPAAPTDVPPTME